MKSSRTTTSHTGMIINHARSSRCDRDRRSRPAVRDKLGPLRENYKQMKSSMTYPSHIGIDYKPCGIPRPTGVIRAGMWP
ncbi:hypothetical protein SAMN05192553_11310 [Cyclobacterium xiamenense]|uniref:Uncharacterized protein n=1 Tax=Cyclobacterium xiamenense TaxID=1297121 RepID=A0A1H7BMJ0_9BACT|nr:hypothetical protein SAMN05192553_11310 [Cyclobacterium xiamenense]